MSSFLNLQSILESETVFSKMKNMFTQPTNELYLCSALNELSSLNCELQELNKKSFKNILEADSKTSENEQFCQYFKEFKSIIDKFINKINELASRCVINIENIIDTHKDLIEDDNIVNQFTPFSMDVHKFKNLDNKEVPKFKAKKMFCKEFDHIGSLMQDLGPIASDEAKLKIIVSVYNSMKKEMDEDFLEKCAEKLLDDEDYDKKCSFSEQIYKLFREEKETKEIDKADIQEAKSALMNYIVYIESVKEMAEKLSEDFNTIADAMGDMIFRNKSCTMKIDTETDGVVNREYNLNTYSMNQFNIFMKTKSIQVNQICNMYMVAFSIKLDSIVDFINQNKTILEKAKESYTMVAPPEKDEPIDEMPDDEEEMEIEPEDDSFESDPEIDEIDDGEEEPEVNPDEDPGVEEIEPEDVPVNDEETPTKEDVQPSLEQESYFFEYELFNLENTFQQEMLRESLMSILEEEQQTDGNQQNNNGSLNNLKSMADSNSNKAVDIWRTIVEKLKAIFKKFYDMFLGHVTVRVNWLKKHEKDIKAAEFGDSAKIKVFDIKKLKEINVPDFNYQAMKDSLSNKENFIKANQRYFANVQVEKDKSFAQSLKNTLIPYTEDQPLKGRADINKDTMYNFCVNEYKTLVADIQKQNNIIDKAQANASRIAKSIYDSNNNPDTTTDNKTQDTNNTNTTNNANANNNGAKTANGESAVMTADMMYFNEYDEGEGAKSVKNDLMTYFSVCSSVLSIKMSVAQSAFNEFYVALKSLVNSNDKPGEEDKK